VSEITAGGKRSLNEKKKNMPAGSRLGRGEKHWAQDLYPFEISRRNSGKVALARLKSPAIDWGAKVKEKYFLERKKGGV